MTEQQNDKWIKAFRNRMENHSEPVPEGLWDSLEKELKRMESPIAPKRSYFIRHATTIAAAVVLAIISSAGLYLWFMPTDGHIENVADTGVIIRHENNETSPLPQADPTSASASAQPQPAERALLSAQPTLPKPKNHTARIDNTKETPIQIEENSQPEEVAESHRTAKEEKPAERKGAVDPSDYNLLTDNRPAMPAVKKRKQDRWAVSLSMGNNPLKVNSTNPGFDALPSKTNNRQILYASPDNIEGGSLISMQEGSSTMSQTRQQVLQNVTTEKAHTNITHKLPIAFGLSGRYALSKQFAIEAGVMYTMLSSERRSGSETNYYIDDYKLHYLGIPVKGNWTFVNNKKFTLYLSAGGAVEKSISGSLDSKDVIEGKTANKEHESLEVKELQWSLAATAGAQYNISKLVAIYVEPGIAHYFDDGNPLETFRKKKPTNFNLQMGIRFNLSK